MGESPSRPWGISVPVFDANTRQHDHQPESPPPAPVHMPTGGALSASEVQTRPVGKCPIDHTKFNMANMGAAFASMAPHGHTAPTASPGRAEAEAPYTPAKTRPRPVSPTPLRPTFVNPPPPPAAETRSDKTTGNSPPQMVFNISGPVFIGYPMDQAMQFMQAWQAKQ